MNYIMNNTIKIKLICYYLPQYHIIEENNKWWGPGFTDWINVVTCTPRFAGHHQPQIPADFGFYDLRLEQSRIQQAEMAKQYGVYGFCYYHYWFNGKRLLSTPLDGMLASGRPDFPFCLCWANENWTRAWDGLDHEVLIGHDYSDEDHLEHIRWLCEYVFSDSRYIRMHNKPIVLIYRLDNIPGIAKFVSLWKEFVTSRGFDGLYLCAVKNGFVSLPDEKIISSGFDAIVDFQPNRNDFPSPYGLRSLVYSLARQYIPEALYQKIKLSISANNIVSYKRMVEKLIHRPWPTTYRKFPCAFPSWDNSARRKSATIIQNDSPEVYKRFLKDCISKVKEYPDEDKVVFINAWNEWAEGCHLEPDKKYGHAFLAATRSALWEV
jgi:lipopolysaccharide biosynthesis protein